MLEKSQDYKANRKLKSTPKKSFISLEKKIMSKMADQQYKHSPRPHSKADERSRWDFFTLKLDGVSIEKIIKKPHNGKRQNILLDNCMVIEHSGDALKHFGYSDYQEGLKLKDLVNCWNKHLGNSDISTDWVQDLTDEIFRAIINKPAEPSWKPLKSANLAKKSLFYPIVNHIRRFESNGAMEIDIYLIKVQKAKAG